MNILKNSENNKTLSEKNKEDKPLVSVIIPAYNRRDLLKEAIESVLVQTYNNYEIIVVDDGSDENIRELDCMKNEKIRYFRNANHGVAYSRNYGIHQAKGKYVAFLDSDDYWKDTKLEIQVKQMETCDAKWSQHSYICFYEDENKKNLPINTFVYRNNVEKIQYCSYKVQTSCFMVDRKCVLENRIKFDEKKTFGEDNEFYFKMAEKFPLLCIDDYLGYFRVKKTNAGTDIKKQYESRAVLYREHKNNSQFIDNTSFFVKCAYWYCEKTYEMIKKFKAKSIYKILYLFPWLIFKIETQRLIK